MISLRSILAAAFLLVTALASANAQTRPVRVIPLTPAISTANSTSAAICTPAAAEMKAAIAACGKGEVQATPTPRKRKARKAVPRKHYAKSRIIVEERVVYRDRPRPQRISQPVSECIPLLWDTRARDGRWYRASACVYPHYVEGVTLAACNHLSGPYRYPDINQKIFVDGRWVLYRTY